MMRHSLAAILAAAVLAAQPAAAEQPPQFKEFTFKRIGVPAPGTKKRILVQIEPQPEPDPVTEASADPADPATQPLPEPDAGLAQVAIGDGYDWYWQTVSPELRAAEQGRFLDAIAALDNAPGGLGVNAPRLATMQKIAREHGQEILKATIGTRVSPALVLAVIAVESGGDAAAVSSAGAEGLMQLMPDTATRFGVTDRDNADQSIKGGVAYLDFLLGEFGQDAVLALAGYNAGEGAVMKNSGVPPYAETRGYVPKVLAAFKVARGLCLTPPELPGDGCVFVNSTLASNG